MFSPSFWFRVSSPLSFTQSVHFFSLISFSLYLFFLLSPAPPLFFPSCFFFRFLLYLRSFVRLFVCSLVVRLFVRYAVILAFVHLFVCIYLFICISSLFCLFLVRLLAYPFICLSVCLFCCDSDSCLFVCLLVHLSYLFVCFVCPVLGSH